MLLGRRWHHRVRRHPRRRLRRDRARLQRPPGRRRRASSPTARASRSAATRSSTARSRSSATPCRACSRRRRSRRRSAPPRCARSSAPREIGTIAGCYVTEGTITRGAQGAASCATARSSTTGEIASLRRVHDDVREVPAGFECGIVLRNFQDVKEGDVARGLRDAAGRADPVVGVAGVSGWIRSEPRVRRAPARPSALSRRRLAEGQASRAQPRQGASARAARRVRGRGRPPGHLAALDARRGVRGGVARAAARRPPTRSSGLLDARFPQACGSSGTRLVEDLEDTRMTGDRMRRVDEAMREVLSDAITSEIKDPRVGFVTVTAVETSARPAPRPRVRLRARRRGRSGGARWTGCSPRTASCSARRGRAAPQAHADAGVRLRRHRRPRDADQRAARRGGRICERRERCRASREQLSSTSCAPPTASCSTTHEHPDGDALGSLAAMQQVLTALGKDALAFLAADEFPLPYEYRFLELDALVTEPPDDLGARTLVFLDCGNIDRTPADALKHEDAPDPQHRPPPRQHALRDGQPRRPDASCTAEMVWDLMRGARRGADAGDRRGAVRRPGHRHRPLHVREHRPARAPDGGAS